MSPSGIVASPDLLDAVGSKSPLSLSQNSVLVTTRLSRAVHCIDHSDSELGSSRSFGDENDSDAFSSAGRLDCNLIVRFSRGSRNRDDLNSNDRANVCADPHELDGAPVLRDFLPLGASVDAKSGALNERILFEASNASLSELGTREKYIQRSKLNSDDGMMLNPKEDEEGGELLKHGHSEDEDSCYNYGSDDSCGKNLPYSRNIQHDMGGKDDRNPFLMNSSVAFGADDWNYFVEEMDEVRANPLIFDTSHEPRKMNLEIQRHLLDRPYEGWWDLSSAWKSDEGKDLKDLSVVEEQVLDPYTGSSTRKVHPANPSGPQELAGREPHKEVLSSTQSRNQVRDADELQEYLNNCSIIDIFEMHQEPAVGKVHFELDEFPKVKQISKEVDLHCLNPEKLINTDPRHVEDMLSEDIEVKLDPLSDSTMNEILLDQVIPLNIKTALSDDEMQNLSEPETDQTTWSTNLQLSRDLYTEHTSPTKVETVELNEFLDDVLHDMEEILLDSTNSPGARFSHGKRNSLSGSSFSQRDAGLTVSTFAADDMEPFIKQKMRIDGVEVIGAKQKKGGVSLSERLVGVKEYTVYIMKVWSGNDQWMVERRYRDFLTLYCRLKSLFAEQGWSLPSEWFSIDNESRKVFGRASPDVISERSALIQDCLQSVIHHRSGTHPPNTLLWFLSPQDSDLVPSSPEQNIRLADQSICEIENNSSLGKTIPLIVDIRPFKSMKELLEGQHYCCAGCHKHFDEGRTLVRDFVQTLGWGKPRMCQYTGQLFCSSCHIYDATVLPARVLHYWDFTEHLVCQLAKSYLDSIQDKPMLCVSAVHPSLFTKVSGLLHVMCTRRRIRSMLPFVRCPFRRSIDRGLGCRSYLLDSNDFFALRDLIDLSKGVFSALPTMLETFSRKILEHITEQCLICCDVGIPCSAKQACFDPSSLIFPFQEDEVERCRFCKLVFHKQCFKRLEKCPCQAQLISQVGAIGGHSERLGSRSQSALSTGFLSRLFPKVSSDRTKDSREDGAIILMDSLPSASF
ncbi:hypothetical protein SAY87_003876 [Trapa incisa]|uniref:PX domain-containing protein n=1 Tax=Trapa incisa TaxID=236973 RepID=A0AAN7PKY9_9MYRT|nr:hypothetical protein SAY87_003876 [Trapa incisa]